MKEANETMAFYQGKTKADKALFVENLGWLLSQTREGVERCEYISDGGESVLITFTGGHQKKVNINLNSYAAIVADVARAVL